jgi:hypothetical protein
LLLVPVGSRKGDARLFVLGLLLFAGLIAFTPPGTGGWAHALVRSLGADRPPLGVNPSALGIVDSVLMAAAMPHQVVVWLGPALYALYCLSLIYFSGPLLFRIPEKGPLTVVYAAVFLWLLLAPRIMVYSYVMAMVPALATIRNCLGTSSGRALAIALILAPGIIRLIPGQPPTAIATIPFLVVAWLWIAFYTAEREPPTAIPSRGPYLPVSPAP